VVVIKSGQIREDRYSPLIRRLLWIALFRRYEPALFSALALTSGSAAPTHQIEIILGYRYTSR